MNDDIEYIDEFGVFLYQPSLLILENDCKKPCDKLKEEEQDIIPYWVYYH